MNHIRAIAVLLSISAIGCAAKNPLTDKVRVTDNTEIVRGCEFLGNVRSSSMFGGAVGDENATRELQSQVADMGGNVLYLMTSKSGKSVVDGTSATGEAYKCG